MIMLKCLAVGVLMGLLVCMSIGFAAIAPILMTWKWSAWWLMMYIPYAATAWMYRVANNEKNKERDKQG